MNGPSSAGRWLDLIDNMTDAGLLSEAAEATTDLRSALILEGIAAAISNPTLTDAHRTRLRGMAVSVLDATVTNLKARATR